MPSDLGSPTRWITWSSTWSSTSNASRITGDHNRPLARSARARSACTRVSRRQRSRASRAAATGTRVPRGGRPEKGSPSDARLFSVRIMPFVFRRFVRAGHGSFKGGADGWVLRNPPYSRGVTAPFRKLRDDSGHAYSPRPAATGYEVRNWARRYSPQRPTLSGVRAASNVRSAGPAPSYGRPSGSRANPHDR